MCSPAISLTYVMYCLCDVLLSCISDFNLTPGTCIVLSYSQNLENEQRVLLQLLGGAIKNTGGDVKSPRGGDADRGLASIPGAAPSTAGANRLIPPAPSSAPSMINTQQQQQQQQQQQLAQILSHQGSGAPSGLQQQQPQQQSQQLMQMMSQQGGAAGATQQQQLMQMLNQQGGGGAAGLMLVQQPDGQLSMEPMPQKQQQQQQQPGGSSPVGRTGS